MLEVKNYTPVTKEDSNVVGLVSFYCSTLDLHLNLCKYIRKRNGGFYVSYPTKVIEKGAQEPDYIPYFCWGKKMSSKFQSEAQKAIHKWIQENGQG